MAPARPSATARWRSAAAWACGATPLRATASRRARAPGAGAEGPCCRQPDRRLPPGQQHALLPCSRASKAGSLGPEPGGPSPGRTPTRLLPLRDPAWPRVPRLLPDSSIAPAAGEDAQPGRIRWTCGQLLGRQEAEPRPTLSWTPGRGRPLQIHTGHFATLRLCVIFLKFVCKARVPWGLAHLGVCPTGSSVGDSSRPGQSEDTGREGAGHIYPPADHSRYGRASPGGAPSGERSILSPQSLRPHPSHRHELGVCVPV